MNRHHVTVRGAVLWWCGCIALGLAASGCSTSHAPYERQEPTGAWSTDPSHARSYESLLQQRDYTRAALLREGYDGLFDAPRRLVDADDAIPLASSRLPSDVVNKSPQPQPDEINGTVQLTSVSSAIPRQETSATLDRQQEWHLRLGRSLLLNGNSEHAGAAYRQALRADSSLAEAYVGLGLSLVRQDSREAAMEAYHAALALRPEYSAALVHLGYLYADETADIQDLRKARKLFQRAIHQGDPFATLALLDLESRSTAAARVRR